MLRISRLRSMSRFVWFLVCGHHKSVQRLIVLAILVLSGCCWSISRHFYGQTSAFSRSYRNSHFEAIDDVQVLQDKNLNVPVSALRGFVYGQFCIAPNVIARDMEPGELRISLVIHGSADKIDDSIVRQIENWDGPISLAVVFNDRKEFLKESVHCKTKFLKNLQSNNKDVRSKLSVHFLIENDGQHAKYGNCLPVLNPGSHGSDKDICDKTLPKLSNGEKLHNMVNYPVNFARNLARNMTSTKYLVIADLDHLFSKNFEAKMLNLAERVAGFDPTTALAYRIFEVDENVSKFPENKLELKKLMEEKRAKVFHYPQNKGHDIPRLKEWFKKPMDADDDTEIQFYREYADYAWEPQFVSTSDIPHHDETFRYPLFDNTVLRWEMCRSGFKFAIVHDVFMYHPGIQRKKKSHVLTNARRLVFKEAMAAGRAFDRKMNEMLPETAQYCPSFDWQYLQNWYGSKSALDELRQFIGHYIKPNLNL